MNILGIYGGFDWEANKTQNTQTFDDTWVHDSGASLFINGNHVCSILEERLTRIKYEGNFPINSIEYCLSSGNILKENIDFVLIPSMVIDIFYRQHRDGLIESKIKALFPNAKLKIISHHLAHAASSVFSSKFNHGTFISLDYGGSVFYTSDYDQVCHVEANTLGYFNIPQNSFRLFADRYELNNFGSYYHEAAFDIYAKKMKHDDNVEQNFEILRESVVGKIMGLSAYGDHMGENVPIHYDSSRNTLREETPCVIFNTTLKKKQLALRSAEEQSYIIQKNFERGMIEYLQNLNDNHYIDGSICFAGGCFLNVLSNSLIRQHFQNIHIPPFPNDTGLSFGAASFGVFKYENKIPELPYNIALLGKKYSNEDIQHALDSLDLEYEKIDNFSELCNKVAHFINDNKIIGWFQNKSEFGPRALGSRSILMSPNQKENKDILNVKVKNREYWRPFAGVILEEYIADYFEETFCSPYMLYSFIVKSEKREEIPAITHIDNTCRVQTVNKEYYPEITELLYHVLDVTGTPVLLNTSFNNNGEPIVETPKDALLSFNKMNLDYLVIGNFLLRKTTNSFFMSYN